MKDQYIGRRADAVPVSFTLERDLVMWLAERAPGKTRGRYLSRLIAEERIRQEERLLAKTRPAKALVD